MLPSQQFGDVAGGSHSNGLPREKTPGLVWEFEVWVKTPDGLRQHRVTAETSGQAVAPFERVGYAVQACNILRPIIDPDRPWLCLAAAAAYMGVPASAVQSMMADGTLPRPRQGRPMFHRDWLNAVMIERSGAADWKTERELRVQAELKNAS